MKANEIIQEFEKKYPVQAAETWDNPGLLVGKDTQEVQKIYLALDVTKEVVRDAVEWGADMIVSHHPMIFSSMKQINNHSFLGEKILSLIENHICCYAMHTNFDVCGMADINARLLKLEEPEVLFVTEESQTGAQGIGRAEMLPKKMTLGECAEYVKTCYHLPQVKIFGEKEQMVEKVAVCGGSGKSMIGDAIRKQAQVLITGDIDHHSGLDALDQGLAIIDAGHYGTEYFFMEQIRNDLENLDGTLEIRCAEFKLPYSYL